MRFIPSNVYVFALETLECRVNYYPKYGYNYDEDRNEIIDEVSANIVRLIFDLVGNKGLTLQKVADILNDREIPTRSYYATEVLGLKALNANPAKEWNAEKVWDRSVSTLLPSNPS